MLPAIHIAVDGMGGDQGPRLALSACRIFLQRHPAVRLSVYGCRTQFADLLDDLPAGLTCVHASQVIAMDEKPFSALRHKRDSSMWLALNAVASGAAHACVSAGSTGALMALARHILGASPPLQRPAICKPIPTATGACWMLDLGANLEANASVLLALAQAGAQVAQAHLGRPARVALLNIGTEPDKGPATIREAAGMLAQASEFTFLGFIEPGDIFSGRADVVVCDGYSGNIALKASEGAARFLFAQLREMLCASYWGRCIGILAKPLLVKLHAKFSPSRLNGALLLGLKGVVVKSHGGADVEGYVAAMEVALSQAIFSLA